MLRDWNKLLFIIDYKMKVKLKKLQSFSLFHVNGTLDIFFRA